MKVNHGGHFYEDNGKLKYVNGEVEYFDFCQVDYMSLIELDDFAGRLGYEGKVEYCYKLGIADGIGSLKHLDDDMDVLGMVTEVGKDRIVEIYMVVPQKPFKCDYSHSKIKFIELSDDDNEEDNEVEEDEEANEQDFYEFAEEEYGFSFD